MQSNEHLKSEEFVKVTDDADNETITRRRNLFKVPSGKATKLFIKELPT